MSEKLITVMNNLLLLNKSLSQLADKKRESVISNDIDLLNQYIKEEQKHILALRSLEEQRGQAVQSLLGNRRIENPTLKDCMQVIDEESRQRVEKVQDELTTILLELKEKNKLNHELIMQSLQFVNLSLDLLNPEPEDINYSKLNNEDDSQRSRSIFDSKA